MPSTVLHCGKRCLMRRTPSMVSTALPVYCASPEAHGKTSGSKYRSSAFIPYLPVSSSKERSATSSLRWRVTAMPFSSMQPTTSAAPNSARQRDHLLEALLAVLQVHRVDDGLALAVGERHRDDALVRGVDHQRHAHLLDDHLQEAAHVLELVAVRVRQADVDDLRAALHLGAGDLRRVLELPRDDELLELLAADDVGALADDDGAHLLAHLQEVHAGERGARRRHLAARHEALHRLGEGARRGPACVPQQPPTTLSQPCSQKRRSERASISGDSR